MTFLKLIRLLIGASLFARAVAGPGEDFANNLFSDLGPQATGWADNIILAMAPLGIITIIVSAIRVSGPPILKAIIGRARESRAVAEAELMSSTSGEVCELWSGQEIVRVMGKGPIREFIILFPEEEPDGKQQGSELNQLRAWWKSVRADAWVDIAEKDTHISKVFPSKPTEASAIDDFGIILIPKNNNPPPPKTAFGFALRLAEEERIEGVCNISSYLTTARKDYPATRSTGQFMNPILKQHQIAYLATTEAGVSGSVVRTGYNGKPVAVAIHNYGPKRKSPKYGSRGSRIDMKMMREIMEWTGVYKRGVAILAQPAKKSQPTPTYPLYLSWSETDKILRVHVQDDTEPIPAEAVFEALPVYSSAMLLGDDPKISWNVEWDSASFASSLGRARLARWEVKGKTALIALNWQDSITEVVVRTDDGVVKPWELEFPDSDYSGVAYQKRAFGTFKNSYNRFILQDV
ncbi:hypothetical protein B0J15DRAFT_462866 [Fusarium solani]|uniref:Uncharacterized protein n=1 Tax=Fusarium solani TaxID=169388 RepID=A0A9P9KUN8_FUSSL|nr:uncharacterized protein B0J15DRAFT_462866 [Fusarium solani]KAH7268877.1 hypothetical protein B0J15DRAFT_462866 [Fusarium solani]